ncbi:hypothetical protein V5O48_014777 [Marasmius crinis-equi]|uniref:Cytochrome P450 n=1 Tax=Marasmius crinis-equi TaxID=585013 RepID=A0ABR3EWC0_9AGAR
MSSLSHSGWQVLLTLFVACAAWGFFRRQTARNIMNKIPGPRAPSWLKGNYADVFGPGWDFHSMLRTKYGPTSTFSNLFGQKYLYTFDPKAMHQILVKDQSTFEEQPAFIETNKLIFGLGLLSTLGDHHRKQRKMLNPVFSVAHMRNMLPMFHNIVHKLKDTIARKVSSGEQEIDILSWSSRTALELIGQAGLGYSFDPLTDEQHAHPYAAAIKELIPLQARMTWARVYIVVPLVRIFPQWFLRFLAHHVPIRDLQRSRELSSIMWNLSTDIYRGKLRALEAGDSAVVEQIGSGKDIISILMNENMKASEEEKLDEDEIIGQNLDVQSKLRQEFRAAREARDGEDLPYDELVSLPYLDAVCRETLRLHAPISRVIRTTTKDTSLPLSAPIRCEDGSLISEIPLAANTDIYISILNANRNVDLWGPDALEWKPERWLSPLPQAVADAKIPGVYSHLMTFIGGGRSCIGFKFSQLEMKAVLFHLVEKFEFKPSEKEIYWMNNGIVNPMVKAGGKGGPQLPIKIELAK